jgi:hypothetical protein
MRQASQYLGGVSARVSQADTVEVNATWLDPYSRRMIFQRIATYEADPRSRLDVLECLHAATAQLLEWLNIELANEARPPQGG